MTKLRYLLVLPVLLAGFDPAAAADEVLRLASRDSSHHAVLGQRTVSQYGSEIITAQYDARSSQGGGRDVIPPSVALRVALSYSPGSQGLGVNLVEGRRLVYAVKLKTGNRVHRVLVDARTGQIVGE